MIKIISDKLTGQVDRGKIRLTNQKWMLFIESLQNKMTIHMISGEGEIKEYFLRRNPPDQDRKINPEIKNLFLKYLKEQLSRNGIKVS
ncbi:MAG: hypothetical protein EAX96_02660 [Candidatus Lokiarchaeota archaeon]|nr:hypothetical protein [Candidatus Lokiarchaeota archaeon]